MAQTLFFIAKPQDKKSMDPIAFIVFLLMLYFYITLLQILAAFIALI